MIIPLATFGVLPMVKSANLTMVLLVPFLPLVTGADPGFLERGFKYIKRGFVFQHFTIFFYISP